MPPVGMGGFGPRRVGAANPAAGPNASLALFGNRYGRPSYGGNPFHFGVLGGASGAGAYSSPGGRYRQATYMQALDAASRAAATRSRGLNALTGGARADGVAGTDTSSIWAHAGIARGPFEVAPDRSRIPGEMGNREQREARYTDPLFQTYLKNLAVHEGGLSKDSGGPTNQGVSQRFLDLLHKGTSKN